MQIASDAFFFVFLVHSASGSENDLNYFELPVDVNAENSLNEIDGRPLGDETVGISKSFIQNSLQ